MPDATPPAATQGIAARTLAVAGAFAILAAITLAVLLGGDKTPDAPRTTGLLATILPAAVGLAGALAFIAGALRAAVAGADHVGPVLPAIAAHLSDIARNSAVPDAVKRLRHRSEDLHAIRQTIAQDIAAKQHESALCLIKELADTYGHVEEAEEFRERVTESREAEYEDKAQKAIDQLDQLLEAGDFEKGIPLAGRISRTFADSVKAQNLDQRVKEARNGYKAKLETQFRHAAEHEDVDLAMDLLKKLDQYLTPQEAAPLVEIARSVIHKKKDNLTVRFKLALHDKEWATALSVGEQIIREFPNGQAAKDVKKHMDVLRDRAATARRAATIG